MIIMKKLTAIFLCFAMALSLAACGNTTSSTNESSTPESSVPPASSEASDTSSTAASQEPASQEETEVEAGNTLVVYFSATGNTEQAATYIADITGGDLFELEPADPYTDEDLNYNNEDSRVSQEYADESLRDVELVSDTVETGTAMILCLSVIPSGGELLHGRWIRLWKRMTLPAKQ